jgi:hypothetical protein
VTRPHSPAGPTAGSCSAAPLVGDLVGYGSATDYEGGDAALPLTSTTAAVRAAGGCTDSNANSTDFTAAAPSPRNSASPAASCSGGTTTPTVAAGAAVDADVQPVLSISLERPALSFGTIVSGTQPAPISERITVSSNNRTGYALTVHRTAFTPADLPLGLATSAGGTQQPIPVTPAADLLVASSTLPSAPSGDTWPAFIGFASPLPVVGQGHYTATLTFTVIGQ